MRIDELMKYSRAHNDSAITRTRFLCMLGVSKRNVILRCLRRQRSIVLVITAFVAHRRSKGEKDNNMQHSDERTCG